jgi:hypothetical protein
MADLYALTIEIGLVAPYHPFLIGQADIPCSLQALHSEIDQRPAPVLGRGLQELPGGMRTHRQLTASLPLQQ